MKYLVQIDGTNPKNWREVSTCGGTMGAAYLAAKPLILEGHNPQIAYVGLGETRHANGAPICVQSFTLHIKRD